MVLLLFYFKYEYNCLLHLLMVLLQMLIVRWSWQLLPVQGLQVIAALSRVMVDFVRPFLGWAKLPLGRIFGSQGDFA